MGQHYPVQFVPVEVFILTYIHTYIHTYILIIYISNNASSVLKHYDNTYLKTSLPQARYRYTVNLNCNRWIMRHSVLTLFPAMTFNFRDRACAKRNGRTRGGGWVSPTG